MSLCFHENYEIFCCISVKDTIGSLIGIALNQSVALGGIVSFTKMILPIQEHGLRVHLYVYL